MFQILRRRPLWRSGFVEVWLQSRQWIRQETRFRYISTRVQDVDDIPHVIDQTGLSGRVYILGVGNVGCFVAHSLASRQSRPPITLLMHHPGFYESFRQKKKTISVQYNNRIDQSTGYESEVWSEKRWHAVPAMGNSDEQSTFHSENLTQFDCTDDVHIDCLVVCAKTHSTKQAIRSVRHRLNSDSTILLLQNGMGMVDILNKEVFPDPQTRPNFIQGVFSHGLMKRERFMVLRKGVGTTILAPTINTRTSLVGAEDTQWAPTTKYLLRLFSLTPSLVASVETPAGLLQWQLEKLAVNCVINPLTALNECKNGDLLYLVSCTRIMRLLLFEISSVICALPELQGVPGIEARFSPERLVRQVLDIASRTAANRSSMAQDMRQRRRTEIEFLNGWIVRRGEELGIKCVVNYMIKHLVIMKTLMKQREEAKAIPIDYRSLVHLRGTQSTQQTPDSLDISYDEETPDDVEVRENTSVPDDEENKIHDLPQGTSDR